MAPLMIIETKIKNYFKWPSYHLEVDSEKCIECHLCEKSCPMSLKVTKMVQKDSMNNTECILCGNCVQTCQQGTITIAWKWKKRIK